MKKYLALSSKKTVFLLIAVCVAIIGLISCGKTGVNPVKTNNVASKTSGLQDTAHTDYTNSIIGSWAIVTDSMAVQTANGIVPIVHPTAASAVDSMFTAFAIDKTIQFQSGNLIATSPNGVYKTEFFGWHTQAGSHTNIIITNSNIKVDQANIISTNGTGQGATLKLYIPFGTPQTVTDGSNTYTANGYYVYLIGLAY